jgi:hypothetical protein
MGKSWPASIRICVLQSTRMYRPRRSLMRWFRLLLVCLSLAGGVVPVYALPDTNIQVAMAFIEPA